MQEKLRIAVQKSGRLSEDSLKLLKECGIGVPNGNNQLKINAENFDAEILFLRDDDIPEYVQDGVADIGFVGENVVLEKNKAAEIVERLGYGKCRLSIALPKTRKKLTVKDLDGMKIATSYPFILNKWLKQNKIKADIHVISGSVEIAPRIGLADAICDLVSSGSTLFSNELSEFETILKSEAVLISGKKLSPARKKLLEKLLFRIRSVRKAKYNKYVMLNAPNKSIEKICAYLPGISSPTIVPLAKKDWSSVHSVISEADFWNVIENLKAAGAEGILIIPIEKMIE
ncbi:ATP phosphoribosyltransferase [Niabella drilacis]|uniref:ATP phosphoribosyltransferase n=1 Tax=Niabella drilacis (strain DSM 25811 / CCM 8410 / CCUG 62505 / LMG 26954 / E90) TaxID=1285928 RepID=A0A1G6J119_NIADE|nr:ATP phosphoribosyltransferase [Niabella drilacis]SDC12340.1 ATP phosphoribosyltransferase [Niabella drilacis]